MTDIKNLATQTIQLQHGHQLLLKKVDVVGVILSKVNNGIETLDVNTKRALDLVGAIEPQNVINNINILTETVKREIEVEQSIESEVKALISQSQTIDDHLSTARDEMIAELTEQSKTHDTHMSSLSERLDKLVDGVNTHNENTNVDGIMNKVASLQQTTDSLQKTTEHTTNRMEQMLDSIEDHIKEMDTQYRDIMETNNTLHAFMGLLTDTLDRVDDKVCKVSPLYISPRAEDIEESFKDLAASANFDHLMNTSGEFEDLMESLTNDTSSQSESEFTSTDKEQPDKQSLLARFFGGS